MDCRNRKRRRGSFTVEAVVALALLATAMAAIAKLSRSSAQLQHLADGRLAATLAAENLLARVRDVPIASLAEATETAARQVEQSSGCRIRVASEPFTGDGRSGTHLTVTARPTDGHPVVLHDWRLEAAEASETPTEAGDET